MSAFNIWVTEKCNLNCSYCYEGEKRCIDMSDEVIEKTVSFIHDNMAKNEANNINFHGGEPLLAFEKIIKIIHLCDDMGDFCYSLTTNGTVINNTMLEKLKENRVYISLSIDGTKEIHDFNRKRKDGSGSYDWAVKSLKLLQEKEMDIRVRMTVTPDTVSRLYDSVMSIVGLEAKTIVAMIDLYDKRWTDELFNLLQDQLILIHKELKAKDKIEFCFYSDLKRKRMGCCDGGISNFNISADGNIYPCSCVVNDEKYKIGSVFTGIDRHLLSRHTIFYDKRNETCDGCGNEYFCLTKRCKYINKSITGEYLTASPVMCKLEHITHNIISLVNG